MKADRRRVLRVGLAAAALALPAGCGFSPVYGTGGADGGDAADDLAAIKIGIIADREGQILHNLLLDRFNPTGRPRQPVHSLVAELDVSEQSLGVQLDATTTRAQVRVNVIARLQAFGDSHEFRSRSVASYSTSESDYASEVARQAAVKRSLVVISDDLRLQIATFFEKQRLLQG